MPNLSDFRILEVDTCESTQSFLSAHTQENTHHASAVIANEQTKGRGQREKEWISPKNKGWYFSIYIPQLHIPIFQLQVINWIVSLELIRALEKLGIRCKTKWPNDIYTEKGKLAGILIENQLNNRQVKSTIIGIGINLFPISVQNSPLGVSSLREEVTSADMNLNRNEFIQNLAEAIREQLTLPLVNLRQWHQKLQKYSYGINRFFTFEQAGIQFNARIKEIDSDGILVLENNQGLIKAASGTIKWINHV